MRYVISSANYVMPQGEVNDLPSLTVPDMTIPLKVLLEKYTRGQALPVYGEPVYTESEIPDPRFLDLVDIQERRMNLNLRQIDLDSIIESERVNLKGGSDFSSEAPSNPPAGSEPSGLSDT